MVNNMANDLTLYPVLPLRDIVVFPNMVVPLFVGREKSVKALEVVMAEDKEILLSSQIDATDDEPTSEGIYSVGVLANVLQLLKSIQSILRGLNDSHHSFISLLTYSFLI